MVTITATGLDEAIRRLTALRNGGLKAIALQSVGGDPTTLIRWKTMARNTASRTLTALMRPDERPMRAGLLATLEAAFTNETLHLTMAVQADLMQAAEALGESLYLTRYKQGKAGAKRTVIGVRQTPGVPDPDEEELMQRVRAVVRQWVEEEKAYTSADADVNFDPEAITDRIMTVMGLTHARNRWKDYLDHPEKRAKARGLAAVIQDFIVRRSGPERNKIVTDREKILGDPVREEFEFSGKPPPEVEGKLGVPGYGELPAARVHDLLVAVLEAWKQDALDALPRSFENHLRAWFAKSYGQQTLNLN
ncbi:MAG: hypothetical protein ACYDC1_06340 [Limisphaerales bacterium]